jgi:Zinc carboxypeptidase
MTRTRPRSVTVLAACAALTLVASIVHRPAAAQVLCDPIQEPPVFLDGVPTGDEVPAVGFPIGSQEVTSAQANAYIAAVDAASDRVTSGTAATSVLNKDLNFAIVGDEANVTAARLFEIREAIGELRDPATTTEEAAQLAEDTPAILWVDGSPHGGEESGGDTSLRVLYELAARTDCAAERILDEAIVVIVPVYNPDGRDLDQRRNANGFDMNRDWFARTQPEIDGVIELMRQFPPQLVIDAHEMGNFTYFFPPNSDPIYHEIPDAVNGWINDLYGPAMAAEFDRQKIPFFNFSPFDFFGVYYGDTVPATGFHAAGMTFEKYSGDPIAQRVHEHYTTIWTSLSAAAINKDDILEEWHASFVKAFTDGQNGALEPNAIFQRNHKLLQEVPPDLVRHYFLRTDDPDHADEAQRLIRRLQRMDVDVYELTAPLEVPDFEPYFLPEQATTLPAGTYWIPMAQGQKNWIQAMLHEDPYIAYHLTFDVSGWSNPLLMNVPGGSSGAVLDPQALLLPLLSEPPAPTLPADLPNIAIFENENSTSNFESAGWLRWLFRERWHLPEATFETLSPADVAAGGLDDDIDVLIAPNMFVPTINQLLGKAGKRALVDWVNEGGRYIGYRGGAELATRYGISTAQLQQPNSPVPGSLIRVELDPSSPLADGVGEFAWVMYESDRILNLVGGTAPATFPAFGSEDFAVSGLATGADRLGGTAAVIDEPMGDGRTIVFSTDPNFRAWTEGMQQVLFNAILGPNP